MVLAGTSFYVNFFFGVCLDLIHCVKVRTIFRWLCRKKQAAEANVASLSAGLHLKLHMPDEALKVGRRKGG